MFIVLHLAGFALQAVLRTEAVGHAPDPRPAALFAGRTKKSLVVAVNTAARAAGVEPGMSAPQALARCASLLIRSAQPEAETDARAALLAVAFTVSPAVELTAEGICTLGATGLAPAKRPEITRAALGRLATLGLHATAGIAPTPLLALYAARATATVLAVTEAGDFLAPLPLATIDPSPALAEILQAWGLHTLGDLTNLPRAEIGQRLGPEGLALWDRARGGELRPLHLVAPPQTFFAAQEFEEEIETLEPLLFILRRFLDRLALELHTAGLVAAELQLTLQLTDKSEYHRSFRLPEPTNDSATLFRVLHTHLESLQTRTAIRAMRMRAVSARPLVRQHGLFDTGLRDPHGFAETLARLGAVVGSERVGTPQVEDTHRADAVKLTAVPNVVPPLAAVAIHPPLGLPLRRFRPALPARLEITGNRPTYLWTEKIAGPIISHRGPWHGSGDWWESERSWRRTEWDIAVAGGGLYRLLRIEHAWFIEGEYD